MDGALKQKDPVCGKEVALDGAVPSAEFEGNNYYFCSRQCREKFMVDPEYYVQQMGIRDEEHSAV